MKIKKPPHILVIHLKRFKYIEQLGRYKKLSYRVVFPLELKLSNTMEDADSEYSLFAVVVHVGSGPNHGHYVSLVKSHNHWLFFDDENVEMIDESAVQTFFGSAQEYSSNTDHGYILFYECLGSTSNKSWEEGLLNLPRLDNLIIWTHFSSVLFYVYYFFPFFNLWEGDVKYQWDIMGCEKCILRWLPCTVDGGEAHRPLVFHNKKKKSSVYGVREFHRESLYSSWLRMFNWHQKCNAIGSAHDGSVTLNAFFFFFGVFRLLEADISSNIWSSQ